MATAIRAYRVVGPDLQSLFGGHLRHKIGETTVCDNGSGIYASRKLRTAVGRWHGTTIGHARPGRVVILEFDPADEIHHRPPVIRVGGNEVRADSRATINVRRALVAGEVPPELLERLWVRWHTPNGWSHRYGRPMRTSRAAHGITA